MAVVARTGELLRIATSGSVDDGKSTLIGRLLFDSKQVLQDQLAHVEEVSERRGDGYVNLALLTDGLRAEREQGITIDVAYRYFATPRRKFIIASTRAFCSLACRRAIRVSMVSPDWLITIIRVERSRIGSR